VADRINRRDLPWVVLIAVAFVFGLAVSWERWGNPLVDCGREMNQALRLARGETLYSDVRHIYGPLSPNINATLFRLFGPSLEALYVDGVITALLIIALVYWLGRQLMGRAQSAAAALSVMFICTFKQAGNHILPYSYSALHGCALGLVTLALVLKAIGSEGAGVSRLYVTLAGISAGLTALAKNEMGAAAFIIGIVGVVLASYPRLSRSVPLVALFSTPVAGIIGITYVLIAAEVGWSTLAEESFLFLQNLPSELVYFNMRMSGFDQPLVSLGHMAAAAVRIGALALVVASVSLLLAGSKAASAAPEVEMAVSGRRVTDAGSASYGHLWVLLGVSAAAFALAPSLGGMQWDKGPYLAMPLLLAALVINGLLRYQRQVRASEADSGRTLILIVAAVYAMVSLTRVLLRVRSGGAYSSYLLPASVVLFTYCWTQSFPNLIGDLRARLYARRIMIGLIFAWVAVTAGVVTYRFRTNNTYPIATPRGTIVAVPDLGQAFNEALQFINQEMKPTEPVAVLPEGTSLNFFTDRPNPLREEIATPGYLTDQQQGRAIKQLIDSRTRFVLVTNRATPEFGAAVFGRDYCQRLMSWIDDNFEVVAVFGPDADPALQIGDRTFFIRAYRKKLGEEPVATQLRK
jgi:hypothetical protein